MTARSYNMDLQMNFTAVQWNAPNSITGEVKLARDCDDVEGVEPTSYMEIHRLLGTSGCSNKPPYWDWSAMGVIKDHNGNKLVVNPSDWVVHQGEIITVLTNEQYRRMFDESGWCYKAVGEVRSQSKTPRQIVAY